MSKVAGVFRHFAFWVVSVVVGTFLVAWVPMFVFGWAHSWGELSSIVPALGYMASWVFLLVVSSVVGALKLAGDVAAVLPGLPRSH